MRSTTTSAAVTGEPWESAVDGLPLALVRARECVMAPFRHLLRRYELTEPQWRVLKTMGDLQAVELSELARKAALLMPSLSRIVRELELRGYVTKAADPHDLRRMLATLTERGRRLVATAGPECDAVNTAIRSAMGSAKLKRLEGLLFELEKHAASLDISDLVRSTVDVGAQPLAPARQRGRPRKNAEG